MERSPGQTPHTHTPHPIPPHAWGQDAELTPGRAAGLLTQVGDCSRAWAWTSTQVNWKEQALAGHSGIIRPTGSKMRASLPAVTGLGPVERTFHKLFQPQAALGRLAEQAAVRGPGTYLPPSPPKPAGGQEYVCGCFPLPSPESHLQEKPLYPREAQHSLERPYA